jgi:hypothetical protein
MAFREFRDDSGRKWRAWDIKPEEIHPVTRAEDYLADCYVTGWIVFETVTGDEKRRLCPWPMRWTSESEAGLRRLLEQAERVPSHKLRAERQPVGEALSAGDVGDIAAEGEDKPDITDLGVVRTFRYPGGRLWTVCVVAHPEDGGRPVLRFNAGSRHIDLKNWSKAWADEPNEKLAEMLRSAAPRRAITNISPDTPRRRWNDPPPPPSQPRYPRSA